MLFALCYLSFNLGLMFADILLYVEDGELGIIPLRYLIAKYLLTLFLGAPIVIGWLLWNLGSYLIAKIKN